jgi:hypothetical protein
MCVLSMVFDHYEPLIPFPRHPQPIPSTQPPFRIIELPTPPMTQDQAEMIMKLIESFKKAVDAAKVVDNLTGQKDCVDPEKEKLLARVSELEKQIKKMKKSKKPTPKKPTSSKRK